jgi:histidine phosphotransferase ChpT
MSDARSESLELAERVAERLCHDISSSAQALASGLDLLQDARTGEERDEAVSLLSEALAAQTSKVGYARRAYGLAQAADTSDLKALAEALYADLRPTLDWAVEAPSLGPAAARVLLILLQIAADAVAAGGVVRATSAHDSSMVGVDMTGPRVALKDEIRTGLTGGSITAGRGGRWIQGAFVAALASAAGGKIEIDLRDGGATIRVSLSRGG